MLSAPRPQVARIPACYPPRTTLKRRRAKGAVLECRCSVPPLGGCAVKFARMQGISNSPF